MRHLKQKFTLGREKAQRDALMRGLAEHLIVHGSIVTTLAKAKALRTVVEPLITAAKGGTLADRRKAMRVLYTDKAVQKLMDEVAPRYKERPGGYTRIIHIGFRQNDSGKKARIELV